MKKNKKDYCPLPPSKEEAEQKAKYDEFWSDPCWTEPLEKEATQSK